jgi:hypothetical protein
VKHFGQRENGEEQWKPFPGMENGRTVLPPFSKTREASTSESSDCQVLDFFVVKVPGLENESSILAH